VVADPEESATPGDAIPFKPGQAVCSLVVLPEAALTPLALSAIWPRPEEKGPEPIGPAAQRDLLERLIASITASLIAQPEVEAIGLGVPCSLNREDGTVTGAVNLPLAGVALREVLAERIPRPIFTRQRRQRRDAGGAPLSAPRAGPRTRWC
jgi:hypothetical protein